MEVYNVMEEIVANEIEKHADHLNLACRCDRCLSDILAISLNKLPPQYIVNKDRSPYIRAIYTADRQGAINILKTISQAANIVSENKRCGN